MLLSPTRLVLLMAYPMLAVRFEVMLVTSVNRVSSGR